MESEHIGWTIFGVTIILCITTMGIKSCDIDHEEVKNFVEKGYSQKVIREPSEFRTLKIWVKD